VAQECEQSHENVGFGDGTSQLRYLTQAFGVVAPRHKPRELSRAPRPYSTSGPLVSTARPEGTHARAETRHVPQISEQLAHPLWRAGGRRAH
jgi:hypothetical protein